MRCSACLLATIGASLLILPRCSAAQTPAAPPSTTEPVYAMATLSCPYTEKDPSLAAIDDAADVVGACRRDGGSGSPAAWMSAVADASVLDPALGTAAGINRVGVIVGSCGGRAAAWRGAVKKILAMPADVTYSAALGINNHGEIVGEAVRKGIRTAFLRLTDATVVFLPRPVGWIESSACGIDDAGDIAGTLYRADGTSQACLWRARKAVLLGALGGTCSDSVAIDNGGDVIGSADLPGGKSHACLWRGGKATDLGALAGDDVSRALAINDAGDVVGVSGYKTAVLWKNGRLYNLPASVQPAPDWTTSQATAINNKDQIAGWGSNDNGLVTGFLLTLGPSAPSISPPTVPGASGAQPPAP